MGDKIILMGFMGCGKSTIGKALAKKLNYKFLDLDSEIEQEAKMTISSIFEKHGEQHFRKQESKVLKKVIALNEDIVLALGGGTPCYNDNLKLITAYPNVYIRCGVNVLTGRLQKEKNHRPIIAQQSEASLKQFISLKLRERRQFYRQAKFTVVGSRKVNEIVDRITVLIE